MVWAPIFAIASAIHRLEKPRRHPTNALSVPDVSREHRYLQSKPEQLMNTKDKKDKHLNFPPQEAQEFSGGGAKIQIL